MEKYIGIFLSYRLLHTFHSYLLLGHFAKKMLPGNDHSEDAYGILEPDGNTINIDGRFVPVYTLISFT